MATQRKLVIRIFNSECRPIKNVKARIVFRKKSSTVIKDVSNTFVDGEALVPIPSNIKHGVLDCLLQVPGYEHRSIGFLPFRTKIVERDIWLPRNPEDGWNARFTPWNQLGPEYDELKKVLRRSKKLHLRVKGDGTYRPLGRFVDGDYDDIDDDDLIEGKAGLLNLYAKMMSSTVPCTKSKPKPWFPFIKEIFYIQRDRIVGSVRPELRDWVFKLAEEGPWRSFTQYKTASVGSGHAKNIRRINKILPNPGRFKIHDIFSIKSTDSIGNLQLVVANISNSPNPRDVILDADIDENGRLRKHIGDWIRHRLTGKGTHPFHVYDILHRTLSQPLLGYRLV